MLPIRRCQREWEIIPPSGLWKEAGEGEFIDPAASLKKFPPVCPKRRSLSKLKTWLSTQRERRDNLFPSAGNQECTVHCTRQENKAYSLGEFGDRYRYSSRTEKHLLLILRRARLFSPRCPSSLSLSALSPTSPVVRTPSVPNYNPSSRFTAHSREPLQQE